MFITIHHDQNLRWKNFTQDKNLSEAHTHNKIILKLILKIIKDKHWTELLQYQLL